MCEKRGYNYIPLYPEGALSHTFYLYGRESLYAMHNRQASQGKRSIATSRVVRPHPQACSPIRTRPGNLRYLIGGILLEHDQHPLFPYKDALRHASGLTDKEAWLCAYYALATHWIASFNSFPILSFIGPAGTGKSSALAQIAKMVRSPKWVAGTTTATVRDQLNGAGTALIDEGDGIPGLEHILTLRYARETSKQVVNRANDAGGFYPANINLFGATVVIKRNNYQDVAMKSRAIVIHTKSRITKDYAISDIPSLTDIAQTLKPDIIETSNRVRDTWKPLLVMAAALDDNTWTRWAEEEINDELLHLNLTQQVEPDRAVICALKAIADERNQTSGEIDVRVTLLRETIKKETELKIAVTQVLEICRSLKLETRNPSGYFYIKTTVEQIGELWIQKEEEDDDT